SSDYYAAVKFKDELRYVKEEPVNYFDEIKREEHIIKEDCLVTADEIKGEPIELKNEPIGNFDNLSQGEPIADSVYGKFTTNKPQTC
ncbi:hypothetical protein PMAYCL1PPCAC_27876, partial [Pristionchus mayeri]